MKFKQKILFLMILVTLPTFGLLGITNYHFAEQEIINHNKMELNAIATLQEARLNESIEKNLERLQGVTSRTQLRLSLDNYIQNPNANDLETINKIITDAKNSIRGFDDIIILNTNGDIVATTNDSLFGRYFSDSKVFKDGLNSNSILIDSGLNNDVKLFLSGPLLIEENAIGVAIIISEPSSITEITNDYSILGQTGESFMAKRTADGDALFITKLRFDPNAQLTKLITHDQIKVPITQSLLKEEKTFTDTIDYRGEQVFSATRYIDSMDWGLVVKIDKKEALSSLQNLLFITILSISVLIVAYGTIAFIFSRQFTKPLYELKKGINQISVGNYDIEISGRNDEIGDLSKEFTSMAKSLRTSRKELRNLKEIEQLKEEFLSMITHELRTPLTPIMGWCEALKKPKIMGELSQTQEEAVDSIYSNALKLRRLISDVLDVEKLELGKMEFNYNEFKIKDLFDSLEMDFKFSIQQKRVKLECSCDESFTIISDKQRLGQVISNLVNNAIDFVSSDTGVIKVGVTDKGEFVEISVSDNGPGISKEKQENLFQKFYQIDSSLTRKHGGTGLGLAVCKGIVKNLSGTIRVESEEGNGATFYIEIPKKPKEITIENPRD